MAKEINIKAVVDTKQAEKNVDNLNKEFDNTEKALGGVTEQADKLTGGLISGMKGVISGTKTAIASMKTLKGAIIATGIGALIIAVGTLISYFTRTQEGADKIDQAFAMIGAAVDVLVDRISKFGGAIVKFFSGDFKGATEDLTDTFTGLTNEIIRETQAARELEKANQALRDSQLELSVETAKQRAEIKRLNQIAEDTKRSDEERVNAAKQAIQIEQELLDNRLRNAEENLRIITEQNEQGNSLFEDREKEAQAEIELFNLRAESLELQTTLTNKLNILETQLAANRAKEAERQKQLNLEEIEKIQSQGAAELTPQQQRELDLNEMLNKKLARQNEAFEKSQLELKEKFVDEEAVLNEIRLKNKEALEQNILQIASVFAKKGSKAAKGIAVAQVIFDTYKGIQGAFASATTNPITGAFPAYPFIQAAGAAAFGFANVRNILSAQTEGGSASGNASVPRGGSNSAPQRPQAVPNIDAINQGVGGQQNSQFSNIRTYIVQEDQKDQDALSQRLEDLQSA